MQIFARNYATIFASAFAAIMSLTPAFAQSLAVRMTSADQAPRNVTRQMEAAYALLAAKDARATIYLERAAKLKPRDAKILEQLGYARLAAGNRNGAIVAFRNALDLNPSNHVLRLQLVYTQDAEGQKRAAARDARIVAMSRHPRAAEGCTAWNNLAGLPDRMLPKPWFAETYFAPEWRTRDRLGVAPLQMRIGRALIGEDILSVYGSFRGTWDNRSNYSGLAPQVFYDDAAIFAGGLRWRPWEGAPVFAFIEQGMAADISSRNRSRWRNDTRAGLVYGQEWEAAPKSCTDEARFTFTPIVDVYAEAIWYSRYQDMIAYARIRPGVRLMESRIGSLEAYALAAITRDTAGRSDNRFHELGAGLAFKFLDPLRITLRTEIVHVARSGGTRATDGRIRLEYEVRF